MNKHTIIDMLYFSRYYNIKLPLIIHMSIILLYRLVLSVIYNMCVVYVHNMMETCTLSIYFALPKSNPNSIIEIK